MSGKVFLALFVLVALERAAAELCSAHLSYLQLLREELNDGTSDSSLPLLDNPISSKLKGNLLAASFDPSVIEGGQKCLVYLQKPYLMIIIFPLGTPQGRRMNAAKGASISMTFKINSGADPSKLRKAELWLFLEPFPSGELVKLHLRVEGQATNISRSSNRKSTHTWDSRESCIPLDVTGVVKKLFGYFEQEQVEKAEVKITVTLTKVATSTGVRPRVISSGNTCRDLEIAGCKQRPFLVLKYYTQRVYGVDAGALNAFTANSRLSIKHSTLSPLPTPTPSPNPSAPPSRSPTSTPSPNPSTSPFPNATLPPGPIKPRVCTAVDLTVSLNKFSFIVVPKTINIKDCAGSCPKPLEPPSRAFLKQNVTSLSPCSRCVPTEYANVPVVVYFNNIYFLVYLKDALVKTCGCR